MRYTPAALALSLALALSASATYSAPPMPLDPHAAALQAKGHTALAAGQIDAAIDAYEAALAVQPGNPAFYLDLASAERQQGLPGKALHLYRLVLSTDSQNLAAIAGEGSALAEKGALEKARLNLAKLQGLCGGSCPEARQLALAIAKGPAPQIVSAETIKPQPVVTEN